MEHGEFEIWRNFPKISFCLIVKNGEINDVEFNFVIMQMFSDIAEFSQNCVFGGEICFFFSFCSVYVIAELFIKHEFGSEPKIFTRKS